MKLKRLFIVSLLTIMARTVGAEEISNSSEQSPMGLFIEPAVTFDLGATTIQYPSPLSNSTGSVNGFGLGAKLGFHISESVFVALDGRYSMPQYKDSSVHYEALATSYNWGPVVGVQFPEVGMRVWGGLVLGGDLNPDASDGFDVKFKNANGFRVGTGFRVASVSLNLEYQQLGYGEAILEQIGPFDPESAFDNVFLQSRSWIASVSFPFEL